MDSTYGGNPVWILTRHVFLFIHDGRYTYYSSWCPGNMHRGGCGGGCGVPDSLLKFQTHISHDSKIHGANMGSHVDPMFAS